MYYKKACNFLNYLDATVFETKSRKQKFSSTNFEFHFEGRAMSLSFTYRNLKFELRYRSLNRCFIQDIFIRLSF